MSLVDEAIFSSEKNTGFLINSVHKTAAAIVSDFGRGGFRCDGGMRLRHYNADGGGGV